MRVFMRACVHTQCVHTCVHIHPALNAIRCFAGRENRAADCTRIFIRRILCLAERLFASSSLSSSTPQHFMVCISAIPVLCRYTIRLGVGIQPRRLTLFWIWRFTGAYGARNTICPTRASYVRERFTTLYLLFAPTWLRN